MNPRGMQTEPRLISGAHKGMEQVTTIGLVIDITVRDRKPHLLGGRCALPSMHVKLSCTAGLVGDCHN